MKMLLTPLLSMSLFIACQQTEQAKLFQKPIPAKTILNVPYGNDTLQRMDVYLPANRSVDSTKVMLLIHGGGWIGGDKSEFAAAITILQQKLPHYALVNINYRLANQVANHFPTQEQDVHAALNAIIDSAADYQISKDVILLGASAGAHLALLQAYKYTTPVVRAVISFFGPTDMADIYNRSYYKDGLALLVGGTPATTPDKFAQTSPLNFAGKQQVPTLLLHGGKDGLVPVSQSKALKEKLDKAGVPAELVVYPEGGHGWQGADLTDSYNHIIRFLQANVEKK